VAQDKSLKNMEFVLLCSSMFGIDLFGFVLPQIIHPPDIQSMVLLLIDDWQLAMQVNIRQNSFHQSFAAAFLPNFLPPKFLLYGT